MEGARSEQQHCAAQRSAAHAGKLQSLVANFPLISPAGPPSPAAPLNPGWPGSPHPRQRGRRPAGPGRGGRQTGGVGAGGARGQPPTARRRLQGSGGNGTLDGCPPQRPTWERSAVLPPLASPAVLCHDREWSAALYWTCIAAAARCSRAAVTVRWYCSQSACSCTSCACVSCASMNCCRARHGGRAGRAGRVRKPSENPCVTHRRPRQPREQAAQCVLRAPAGERPGQPAPHLPQSAAAPRAAAACRGPRAARPAAARGTEPCPTASAGRWGGAWPAHA